MIHFLRSFVRLIDGLEIDLLPRIARAVRQDLVDLAPKMLVSGLRPSHERAAHAGPAEQAKGGRVVVGAHGEAAPTVTSLREVCSFSLGDDIVVSGLTISSHGAARRNEAAPPHQKQRTP